MHTTPLNTPEMNGITKRVICVLTEHASDMFWVAYLLHGF